MSLPSMMAQYGQLPSGRRPRRWETYVRMEYGDHDAHWYAEHASRSNGAGRSERGSLLARLVRRWEAWEARVLRSAVPGLATELSLPSHPHESAPEEACSEEVCAEALKGRSAMGPR